MNNLDLIDTEWIAKLELHFSKSITKTFLSQRKHIGPLTIQRPFYPEGSVCHVYLLHPPGGVVGGDNLSIEIGNDPGTSALITTPGATKIYRTMSGKNSSVSQNFNIASNSTFEWLPLETIIFPGAESEFSTKFSLYGDAKLAAWEVQCLGLPVNNEPFNDGQLNFNFEIWRNDKPILLDKLVINESELNNIAGLGGYQVFGTFVISDISDKVINLVRDKIINNDDCICGVTQIEGITIIRCLANRTNLIQNFFKDIWEQARPLVFNMKASPPRVWAT